MRRYLALQIAALIFLSAFFGFKASQVMAAADWPAQLAQLPGGKSVVQTKASTKSDLRTFEAILNLLTTDYLEPVEDRNKLMEGAIQGSVAALGDRYSRYIPKVHNTALTEEIQGFYGGIGVLIEQKGGHTLAATVFPEQPAAVAGMEVGDIILEVNGEDVSESYVTDIVAKIKGPVDTDVVLKVYRPALEDVRDLKITRKQVKYPSVWEKKMLPDQQGVGYIKLIQFNEESGSDFIEAVNELKGEGMTRLVLDLRQNTGGTFTDAFEIADALVKSGPLVYTETRNGQRRPFESRDGGLGLDIPLAILTDNYSASASEIVAGAVQDTRSGVLIGTKTFGKGVVQSVIPLTDGSSLILTTARYLTPNGRDINKHGIRPDIPIDVETITKDDPFVTTRLDRIEALSKEAVALREELQEYFRDKDFALDEALRILQDEAAYQAILATAGPTPADDEAAWAAEQAAEKATTSPDGLMNAPVEEAAGE